jgi:ribosomal protein S21
MSVNIEVEKNSGESNSSVLKRFTRRVQGAGILNRVRGLRYSERAPSKYVKKKFALKALRRREEVQKLIKLGKLRENIR